MFELRKENTIIRDPLQSDSAVRTAGLSVIVTAHREGSLLAATLNSLSSAAEFAPFDCSLVVVLDNADELTRRTAHRFASRSEWASVSFYDVSIGETGGSRRFGISKADTDYLALVDGDDLFSRNYLAESMGELQRRPGSLVHPEYVLNFGAREFVWRICPSDEGCRTYLDLIEFNLWPASVVGERSTFLKYPYPELPPDSGFGPEDWFWNISTLADGVAHLVARKTVCFYRVKERAGVNAQHASSILPPIPIDKLRQVMPIERDLDAPCLPKPRPIRDKVLGFIQAIRRRSRGILPRRLELDLVRLSEILRRLALGSRGATDLFGQGPISEIIAPLAQIDSSISFPAERLARTPRWGTYHSEYARLWEFAVGQLEGIEALVVVPWVGIGGADLVSTNYMRALAESDRFRGKTAVLTLLDPPHTIRKLIPRGIKLVQFPEQWRDMHYSAMRRLIASIIIQLQPKLVLSVNGFDVVESMRSYARQMAQHSEIYATFFSWDKTRHGYPTHPITDAPEREHLNYLTGLITDNPLSARAIQEQLGIPAEQIVMHLQPVGVAAPTVPESRDGQPTWSEEHPFRVVWPHRIDREKRLDTLINIASKAKAKNLPVTFDVWGSPVLGKMPHKQINEMKRQGIRYRGPFSGGLPGISDIAEYHALLLTSQNEGLPLVLVEAQQHGIPIIGSAVGGVPFIVNDQETGMLVSGPDDIDGFVDAIEALMADHELRSRIVRNGYQHAVANHSWKAFIDQVDREIISKLK